MYRTLFDGPQDRKFATRSAFNIVSVGQNRPHSRSHSRALGHTPGTKGVHIASHYHMSKD